MRSSALLVVLGVLTLAASSAVAQAPPPYAPLPSVTLPAELERVLRDYERAWQGGDPAQLAALFTSDGVVPTPAGWVRGAPAIQAAYARASGALRLQAVAFAASDTVGYIVGTFRYGEASSAPDRGKFILALRRVARGPWLIVADLDH